MSREEFDPIAEFAQLYEVRQGLSEQLITAPSSVRALLEEGLQTADTQLRALAQNKEVQSHYGGLASEVEQAAHALDEAAPLLASLGMDAQLQAKREEL